MHEKLACLYCMENNKAFTLTNGGKSSFLTITVVFCHQIIGTERTKRISLLAKLKRMLPPPPPRLSSEELHDVALEYGDIVFGLQLGKQKFPGFGLTHNWVKRSIFWELPY